MVGAWQDQLGDLEPGLRAHRRAGAGGDRHDALTGRTGSRPAPARAWDGRPRGVVPTPRAVLHRGRARHRCRLRTGRGRTRDPPQRAGSRRLDHRPGAQSFHRLPDDWTGEKVVGSGFDLDDLNAAGASTAGGLAAVTSGDNTNIVTARIAREHYGIANVVARIYDPVAHAHLPAARDPDGGVGHVDDRAGHAAPRAGARGGCLDGSDRATRARRAAAAGGVGGTVPPRPRHRGQGQGRGGAPRRGAAARHRRARRPGGRHAAPHRDEGFGGRSRAAPRDPRAGTGRRRTADRP